MLVATEAGRLVHLFYLSILYRDLSFDFRRITVSLSVLLVKKLSIRYFVPVCLRLGIYIIDLSIDLLVCS